MSSLPRFFTSCVLMFAGWAAVLAAGDTPDPWDGAEARIQTHRMGDATLRVVDRDGRPVTGAAVRVRQVRHAFRFGANIYAWGRLAEEQFEQPYRQRFADVFNFATIGFYWASYERRPGEPNHDYAGAVARWCAEHGILTKGHPLLWNYSDPGWLPEAPEQIRQLQLARIEDCVRHFQGKIDIWDVVNEAVHFERESMGERAPKMTAMWQQVGRVPLTRAAFQQARQANPEAVLLINDYRVDPSYERLIEQLVDEAGEPLYDAIGLQSHMHSGTWSNERIWDVCQRFARFDVPLHFTELTILSGQPGWELGPGWETTPEGEARQAREVERIYTMLFSHPAVEAITWWDFSDARAWQGAPAGFLRHDMTPKPAYQVLKELIKDRWWTDTEITIGENGQSQVRGFWGDYEIQVRYEDRETTTSRTLARDQENHWEIVLP